MEFSLFGYSLFFTPGPPIITADATQHAVKHSKGKLECRVGSSPPPDKIVSEPLVACLLFLLQAILFTLGG